jgi:hypothetical protein
MNSYTFTGLLNGLTPVARCSLGDPFTLDTMLDDPGMLLDFFEKDSLFRIKDKQLLPGVSIQATIDFLAHVI